jgi:phage terminase large subunit-like protein
VAIFGSHNRSRSSGDFFLIAHVVTTRSEGAEVRKIICATAEQDGKTTEISLPQDPGQAGKVQARDYVGMLAGFIARGAFFRHCLRALAAGLPA